jgi:hypothetical protein
MRVWDVGPGRLIAGGGFSDLAVHHHPVVQVPVALSSQADRWSAYLIGSAR